jgi:hypothetical protein
MKNTERTGAAQRPSHPATGKAQRKKAPERVPHSRYAMHAMRCTAIAFMAPTIVTPLLPAPVRPWRFVACGLLYADQQQQPSDMRFNPPPGRRGQAIGMFFGLLPFIPAFHLQAQLTDNWCATRGTLGHRIAGASQHAWNSFWQHFPKRVAEVAMRYPVNFVLARCMAQVAASIAGSGLSAAYHRRHGRKLVACKLPSATPGLQQRVAARPEIYATGGLLFVAPALLDTRVGQAMLQKAGLSRASIGTVITTSLVSAALTTGMVPAPRSP